MGFSESVATKALTSCGRCCCICHRFCGTKIELHHIKQKAYGGEDTLDNCIPLCFDCHSDMGKVDPKHPKGKHYKEEELRNHRDNWYKKVAGSQLNISNGESAISDKELFQTICLIFSPEIRYWLTEADIGGSHPYDVFEPFSALLHKCTDPFYEFLNVEIEKLKGTLVKAINDFMSYKAINSFVRSIGGKDFCVTRAWLVNHEDWVPQTMSYEKYSKQYANEAQTLNELATTIWDSYYDFVRRSRRLLSI